MVLAAGTCTTYGGIHAMQGNPTGAMGILDDLGWDWTTKAGIPIVCVPGCPIHMDEPPGAKVSTRVSNLMGTAVRALRGFTTDTRSREPKWRTRGRELRTGYQPRW